MSKVIALVGGALMSILLIGMVVIIAAISGGGAAAAACDGTGGGPVPAPPSDDLTGVQIAEYFVRAGLPPPAAAGIVGNLIQESSLDPTSSDGDDGGGLAQWSRTWYHDAGPNGSQSLDAFAAAHHAASDTDTAQVAFIVYDLSGPYSWLESKMQSAPDPGTAATMFETGYENCQGVIGFMDVEPNTPCNDPRRRSEAASIMQQLNAAGASTASTSTTGASSSGGTSTKSTPNSNTGTTTVSVTLSSGVPTPVQGPTCSPTAIGSPPIVNGPTGKVLPNGIAEAPKNAPAPVKRMIAAGNAIIDTFYSQERRAGMLSHVEDSYDCSGSVDFVLYNAGFADSPAVNPYGTATAGDSGSLESFGLPGGGKWVDVYGSAGHAFIIVAGLALDTSHQGLPYEPTTVPYDPQPGDTASGGPESGPRWFLASQILPSQLSDGENWVERHPQGQ